MATRQKSCIFKRCRSEIIINFISKYFSDLTATIYDLNGKILSKEIAKSEIDLSQLKNGVYFIKFSNQKNKLVHKLIVKK